MRVSMDLEQELRTTVTNDLVLMQRGQQFVDEHTLRVRPDRRGRPGYTLIAGTNDYGVFVDVPVLAEDLRKPVMARQTLENAMNSLVYRAGEATVWAH